ncbi:MAG TPA: CerR family C-terminal domain-containing protein [Bryobacteraceae bacterium]|nr:CerR family C-terminal domain-containing protein [Bryobacteraceae bacterium]
MASSTVKPRSRPAESARKPRLPEGTRNKLLDAAGQVFADFGFHSATVREICARAGVNVALVNYYFGDKFELYTEVLRHSIGASSDGIIQQALKSGAPPEEALRELIHAMLRRVCLRDRPGWHFRLMVHEFAQPTPAMATVIDETMRPIYERFRAIIGGMLDLPADHDKTRLCAHSVIAQIVHYVHGRHVISQLWPQLELNPERVAEISNHIADFSLAYLREASRKTKTRKK